jgi:hypothetical protein
MKEVTKEEAAQLKIRVGKSTVVRTAVWHMPVGKLMIIERTDWKNKRGPQQMIMRLAHQMKRKYTVNALADGSGWLVERVE